MRKPNVIIRMGAGKFEASVRSPEGIVVFDLREMSPKDERIFRTTLVRAFKESRE
jgi:hypothetical protein